MQCPSVDFGAIISQVALAVALELVHRVNNLTQSTLIEKLVAAFQHSICKRIIEEAEKAS